jgi:hypothetical protein
MRSNVMNPDHWRTVEEIYHAAMERPLAGRRDFVDGACQGNKELRQEVESLIAAAEQAEGSMEQSAMELAAQSLANEWAANEVTQAKPVKLPTLGPRYRVLEELGRGGMGIVYRVHDNETDDLVAVKVLRPDLAVDEQMIARFKTELKVSWKINHRSVCRLHDINRFEDLTYISMEYIRGETLRRTLNRLGALNVRKGAELIRQVCEGLREAHRQGIFHRDLKPENIMLDETGNVKLMDFGIARLTSVTNTKSASILGTPAYMSPEQAEGKAVDARSDIYSLGLVMYEVFTGSAAFGGNTPIAVALKQINEKPRDPRTVNPLLPETLESATLRCIEKDPAQRFQSLDEVIAALALPLESPTPPAPSRPIRRRWFPETAYVLRPNTARKLLLIHQAGYLALYFATLFYLDESANILLAYLGVPLYAGYGLFLFSATTGIAVRIYLTSAIGVNHPDTGRQFWRLFPALFVFDMLWAMSPLLLAPKIRPGLALAFVVCLAYLPFSQKTLMTNAYR